MQARARFYGNRVYGSMRTAVSQAMGRRRVAAGAPAAAANDLQWMPAAAIAASPAEPPQAQADEEQVETAQDADSSRAWASLPPTPREGDVQDAGDAHMQQMAHGSHRGREARIVTYRAGAAAGGEPSRPPSPSGDPQQMDRLRLSLRVAVGRRNSLSSSDSDCGPSSHMCGGGRLFPVVTGTFAACTTTLTVPQGVCAVLADIVGGGGAGGSSFYNATCCIGGAGGGGGAGYLSFLLPGVAAGARLMVVAGPGGQAAALDPNDASRAGPGTASSVALLGQGTAVVTTWTAEGGQGGQNAASSATPPVPLGTQPQGGAGGALGILLANGCSIAAPFPGAPGQNGNNNCLSSQNECGGNGGNAVAGLGGAAGEQMQGAEALSEVLIRLSLVQATGAQLPALMAGVSNLAQGQDGSNGGGGGGSVCYGTANMSVLTGGNGGSGYVRLTYICA